MKKTIRFNKTTLAALQPPGRGRDIYTDEENKYLKLFVTPSKKVFYYMRWMNGASNQVKIGEFPGVSIYNARARADEITGRLAAGLPPVAKYKAQSIAPTLEDIFHKYLLGHLKIHARTWKEDERRYNRYLTQIGKKRATAIEAEDLIRLASHLKIEHGAITANRCIQQIKRTYNYAIKHGMPELKNPAVHVKLYKESSRERYLTREELQRFLTTLHDELNETWQDFFKLLLYTGARRANVQAMEWEEVDFIRKVWVIPGDKFKNGESQTVILVEPAIEILIKRRLSITSKFVFPSNSVVGHIQDPRRAWYKLLAIAGLKDVRMHDLRRTLGSWQAASGASLHVIGKSLGHKHQATTAIYARLNLDPVRDSVSNAVAAMLDAANHKNEDKDKDDKE